MGGCCEGERGAGDVGMIVVVVSSTIYKTVDPDGVAGHGLDPGIIIRLPRISCGLILQNYVLHPGAATPNGVHARILQRHNL